MGRLVGQKFSEGLGMQVVVDNRGGGNGVIGTEIVMRAPADGHTILITSTNSHLITSLISKTAFHPIDDFSPLGTIDASDNLMIIHPGVPAQTMQEFIALAKAKPGQINYATSTTSGLVTTAMFAQKVGIKIQHVPYKGAGPALNSTHRRSCADVFQYRAAWSATCATARCAPSALRPIIGCPRCRMCRRSSKLA